VVEANKSVPWTKPEDIPFDANGEAPPIEGLYSGDFMVGLGDGSTRLVSKKVSSQTLKAAITRNGGDVLGPDW
jgi:hypothetical protein